MTEKIIYTDRYQALGMPYPDLNTVCSGQCDGTGKVPVNQNDLNDDEGNWHDLWLAAEAKKKSDDDYHFVTCPRCKGSGKEPIAERKDEG